MKKRLFHYFILITISFYSCDTPEKKDTVENDVEKKSTLDTAKKILDEEDAISLFSSNDIDANKNCDYTFKKSRK